MCEIEIDLTPEQDAALTGLARLRGCGKEEAAIQALVEVAERELRRADIWQASASDLGE